MADLYQVSKTRWAVKPSKEAEPEVFPSIEAASACLESLGVLDEAIDIALAELAGNHHTRANFGIEGTFIFTDDERLNGVFGSA